MLLKINPTVNVNMQSNLIEDILAGFSEEFRDCINCYSMCVYFIIYKCSKTNRNSTENKIYNTYSLLCQLKQVSKAKHRHC